MDLLHYQKQHTRVLPTYPQLINPKKYNPTQKNLLNTYVGVKVKLITKNAKPEEYADILRDHRYLVIDHVFDVLDTLKGAERSKLRSFLGKALKREIPYNKETWDENTGALLRGLIDMDIMFDMYTTWVDIQNALNVK
jgi:hypothetical protein